MSNKEFKVGDYWKRRDGLKAIIAFVAKDSPDGDEMGYPVGYWCLVGQQWQHGTLLKNGRESAIDTDTDNDLIEPWKEPREFVRYVYDDNCGGLTTTSFGDCRELGKVVCVLRGTEGDS